MGHLSPSKGWVMDSYFLSCPLPWVEISFFPLFYLSFFSFFSSSSSSSWISINKASNILKFFYFTYQNLTKSYEIIIVTSLCKLEITIKISNFFMHDLGQFGNFTLLPKIYRIALLTYFSLFSSFLLFLILTSVLNFYSPFLIVCGYLKCFKLNS